MSRKTTPQSRIRQNAKPRRIALALLAGAIGASAHPALAQPIPASVRSDERVSFAIAAQPLSSALSDYARQAGVNALYFSDRLHGLIAPPVMGDLTRQEALDRLLLGSGYSGRINGANLVLVQDVSRPQRESAAASGAEPAEANDVRQDEEEIVVTGTRIRGAAPAGSNLIGLDREEIEQSGRTTVQDVLQTLPQVYPGSQGELTQLNSIAPGGNIALGSSVDLRGLGADATLTLLNGRRLAPAGFGTFVDISAIPLAAIERVEVLADGASATYGADAVGGVVNIITRRGLDAAETLLRFGSAEDANDIGVSHVFGGDWTNGSAVAGYEYRRRDALAAADRRFTANSDLTPFGGSNFSRVPAAPGNIVMVAGSPVAFSIPDGQDGLTLTEADLIAGLSLHNGNEGAFLLPEQESHSLFVSIRHDLNDRVSLFLDGLGSQREAHAEKAQLGGVVPVPETNYYRQQNGLFAGDGMMLIGYNFINDFGPILSDTRSRTLSLAGGSEFRLPSDWRLEASIAYGGHVDRVDNSNAADSSTIIPALFSSDPAVAFNPFGDGGDMPADVLAGFTFDQHIRNDSELVTYALRADGGFFDLPGGRARAALGVERRRETFSIDWIEVHGGVPGVVPTQAPGDRTTDAVYAELFLPLRDNAAVSLSLRREDSSDFGEALTPKVGLQWSLWRDLTLRGTWGASFKAPQFQQLLGGTGISIFSLPASLDPGATNGDTGVLAITGANPDLEPEQAETWTAGFDYRPHWLDGFQASATYFDVDFADRIGTPGFILDAFLRPENYVGFFIRNPTPEQVAAALAITTNQSGVIPPDGIEVIFDERLSNLATLRVRGVDLSASFTTTTSWGEASFFASASGLLQFTQQNNPTLPGADLLDTMLNPIDWRARAGVALDNDDWRVGLTLNYADGYRDNLSTPNRDISSWTTYDARLTRRFNAGLDSAAAELSLDIRNIANEDPPFANNPIGMGLDTLNASPLGRVIMIELRQQW